MAWTEPIREKNQFSFKFSYNPIQSEPVFFNTANIPIDILNYIKKIDSFPNAFISYRIMLTISVSITLPERNFPKLKLTKSYLRLSVSQQILNRLILISIEKEI